jgi:hypothetical protein
MRRGHIILHNRQKGSLRNGDTKIRLQRKDRDYSFRKESHGHHFGTRETSYKLDKDRLQPTFRSNRGGRSAKSFCLHHNNAVCTPPLRQQEHCRKCTGMNRQSPPVVLTWHQATCSWFVHSKRTEDERDLEPAMKLNSLCDDG